jgi:hypothetical protein
LSTTKDEYVVVAHGSKEVAWRKILCSGIGFVQKSFRIGCDS